MNANTYLSLNIAELACLQRATFEAIGLYLLFKEKANFRTGELGRFHRQKLTYATFARMMGRPASQGRAAQEFDTTDIKRLMAQLEGLGLVEGVDWDGKRLTLRLPLSPKWKGNPALSADGKLPRQDVGESVGKADGGEVPAPLSPTPSILSSERGSQPFFNTGTGGDAIAAGPLKEAAAAAASATPAALETQVEQFRQIVADEGGVMADQPVSREYYRAWAKAGVTPEQLRVAIFDLNMSGIRVFNPGDINGQLFPRRRFQTAPQLTEEQRLRRGGVVL